MLDRKRRQPNHGWLSLSIAAVLALLLALAAPVFAAGAPWSSNQAIGASPSRAAIPAVQELPDALAPPRTSQAWPRYAPSASLTREPLPARQVAASDLPQAASAAPGAVLFESAMSKIGAQENGLLLGIYPSGPLQISAPELAQLNDWLAANGAHKPAVIAGTFMDVEFPNPEWNVPADLEAAWSLGFIPFVNLAAGTTQAGPRTAQEIAQGAIDEAIRRWARVYAQWSEDNTKVAFIAPLQEMNADWVSYGMDPENYKLAFLRFQRIFAQEGVAPESVIWVFAPNGWSPPGHEFEKYYPGDQVVDAVGFSAFNFGACAPGDGWDPFDEAIAPYAQRMHAMAPGKPIILAQTGTVAEGGDKDTWLVDSFSKLGQLDGMAAVVYFNVSKPEAGAPYCDPVDWRVYDPERDTGTPGFLRAMRALSAAQETAALDHQLYVPVVNH